MSSILMDFSVCDIVANVSLLWRAEDSLMGHILESAYYRVFNVLHVLNSACWVHKNIWSAVFRTKAPNLLCHILLPFVISDKGFLHLLLRHGFVHRTYSTFFNVKAKLVIYWVCLAEKSVQFIGGFRKAHLSRFFGNGFTITHHWFLYD